MLRRLGVCFLLVFVILIGKSQDENVFVIVDEMPTFGGGADAMQKYFCEEMEYPRMAFQAGVKGKVHVTFIVDENGKVDDVKILKGKPGGLSKEAIRLVESMPNWKPGKQSGKADSVQMTAQVEFPMELKGYKDENKKIRCNPMPNIDQYGGVVFQENQYFVWIYNKGVDALKKKEYEKAEDYFNQALEMIGPMDSAHPYFNRAIARYYQGKESLACGDFRRAKKVGYAEIDKTIRDICPE